MIISASYRTDIPAFYAAWFEERLKAGYVNVKNPYNRRSYRVSLKPDDVDGYVFWTRNAAPFMPVLDRLASDDMPFFLSFTLTGYNRRIEKAVPGRRSAIDQMRTLAERFGPASVVWRYDPILISDEMTPSWHRENFAALARRLRGTCDEVVVSFTQFYRKARRNLADIAWRDPSSPEKRQLLADLSDTASDNDLRLSLCAQPDLIIRGIHEARCIDVSRLSAIAGRPIEAGGRGHRQGCGCCRSRDIGAYESCPHGCLYCYAVDSPARAKRRFREHDPAHDML